MSEDNHRNRVILHTVIIVTPNMTELAEFYQQGLELEPPTPTGDDHLGFTLPNVYLGFDLVQEKPSNSPGAVSLWFEVDDLQATFDRLVSLGAAVKYGPTLKPWGATLAAVFDPENNLIGLTQKESAKK